ncbi:unnamed protein product, partial [Musa acuminata subsp. burmannicoides]
IEVQLIFCAPSRKFKILTIPNILAPWKLFKLSFSKKYDGYKVYVKSRFDQFFCTVQSVLCTDLKILLTIQ